MTAEMKEVLVKRAQQNEVEAVLELIENYKPLILSMGQRYNYEKLPIEDLLQEGILILLEMLKRYNPDLGVPFPGFLKKQMFYYFVNKAKHFRFTDSLDAPMGEDDLSLLTLIPCPFSDFDFSDDHELWEQLKECLKKLRDRQRWLIWHYYFKQRQLSDLAVILDLSPNALSQFHRRTLKELRQLLEEAGIDWEDMPF